MEQDYKKTVWVDGSEPDIDAVHLNNIEDGISGLYNPEFDDSGSVEGITSFSTFLEKVVNKMNPIAFYKNFKAGMQFVLHTGQLVNNGLCTEPGKYPLDAAYGKTLKDGLDKVNSDLGKELSTDILAFALTDSVRIGITAGAFSGSSYNGALPSSSLKYGTWIINKRNSGSISIECIDIDPNTVWSNTHSNGTWKGWKAAITNSDLTTDGTVDNPVQGLSIIKSTNGFTICRKDGDYAAQLQLHWWDGLRTRVKTGSEWSAWVRK